MCCRYLVDGFIEKNRDKLPDQLLSMMESSSNAFLQSLFVPATSPSPSRKKGKGKGRGKGKSKGGITICSKFNQNLSTLSKNLSVTHPHYIRCIKPNDFAMRPIDGRISFDVAKTYVLLADCALLALDAV